MNEISIHDKQTEKFLADHNITFRAKLSDTKTPPWTTDGAPQGHHFKITLSKTGKRVTFDFWDSIAHREEGIKTTTPYAVLACISGDVNCPEDFESFCAEYGYSTDSIKDRQQFRRCNTFAKRLRAFFTETEREQLVEIQ